MSNSVLTKTEGGVGYITLNRPDALHALNFDMCETILQALRVWALDPEVDLVMIDHAEGTRGFCAGGDIAMLRESGLSDGKEARTFKVSSLEDLDAKADELIAIIRAWIAMKG